MDDLMIILFILATAAYFVLTQWRKAFKSPGKDEAELPAPQRRRVDQEFPEKPFTSFEDILRELQPKAEKVKAVIEAAKDNIPPLAPVAAPEKKYRSYEEMPVKALSWEKRAEAIEAAKRSQERRRPVFEAYEKGEKLRNPYARLLKNPATVRDAVILTEILNRRYS